MNQIFDTNKFPHFFWSSGCKVDSGNLLQKVGTREFDSPSEFLTIKL